MERKEQSETELSAIERNCLQVSFVVLNSYPGLYPACVYFSVCSLLNMRKRCEKIAEGKEKK